MKLKNKIALITGGSRGIGAAVAKRYAAEGAKLILVGRKSSSLEKIDDELQSLGYEPSTLVPLDLNNFTGIDEMAISLAKRFGKIDVLVANAGMVGVIGPLAHSDPETAWDSVIRLNVTANYRLLRAFDPLLRQSEAGRVIIVSSVLDHNPMAYWASYCASKAAVTMLGKVYADEVKNSNIRVNIIGPHATDTDLLHEPFPGGVPFPFVQPEDIMGPFVELALPSCTKNGEVIYFEDGEVRK